MDLSYFKDFVKIELPIADNGKFWNGKPDEFSNIPGGLDYSQQFGLTPYAKKGVYGYYDGQPRPHNGHDFAGSDGLQLVASVNDKIFVTFVADDQTKEKGADPDGYGNYLFFETETKMINGDTIKMEFVIAHCKKVLAQPMKWYKKGDVLALMDNTGMSSGPHTHFAGRPLARNSDGSWRWAFNDQATRGYVDLTDFFITKPVYDKQVLINQDSIIKKFMATNEKKIIIEGEGSGRKAIIINGELREITKEREAAACLYTLANNGLGKTVKTTDFDNMPKGKSF